MSRFPGVDYMEIDSLLSEEERLVRDTVRAWVDERFMPLIEDCHREGRFPLELVPEMAGSACSARRSRSTAARPRTTSPTA